LLSGLHPRRGFLVSERESQSSVTLEQTTVTLLVNHSKTVKANTGDCGCLRDPGAMMQSQFLGQNLEEEIDNG
jgi:hypothetical protein